MANGFTADSARFSLAGIGIFFTEYSCLTSGTFWFIMPSLIYNSSLSSSPFSMAYSISLAPARIILTFALYSTLDISPSFRITLRLSSKSAYFYCTLAASTSCDTKALLLLDSTANFPPRIMATIPSSTLMRSPGIPTTRLTKSVAVK